MEQNKQPATKISEGNAIAFAGNKITPFLWFNGNVKEAVEFYTSVFKHSKVINISQLPGPDGKIMTAIFEIEGQQFMALDGGPMFSFTHAISFFIQCKTQEGVDYYWEKLSEGGQKDPCGWLKDKFGLSWQVVPEVLGRLTNDPDRVKANNVLKAMMKMSKLDIKALQEAYDRG